ncbi:hypothetical protein EVAR_98219_1 [Eumeta japonica]|uniref:Secreted protein n=1 Tax=Eumeta variegata TaxID=151549 RepID=A0A4C1Y7U7_EUMVA|nr:hypothetical protein EVAR_98219_1 [Eumeta japonica]
MQSAAGACALAAACLSLGESVGSYVERVSVEYTSLTNNFKSSSLRLYWPIGFTYLLIKRFRGLKVPPDTLCGHEVSADRRSGWVATPTLVKNMRQVRYDYKFMSSKNRRLANRTRPKSVRGDASAVISFLEATSSDVFRARRHSPTAIE